MRHARTQKLQLSGPTVHSYSVTYGVTKTNIATYREELC